MLKHATCQSVYLKYLITFYTAFIFQTLTSTILQVIWNIFDSFILVIIQLTKSNITFLHRWSSKIMIDITLRFQCTTQTLSRLFLGPTWGKCLASQIKRSVDTSHTWNWVFIHRLKHHNIIFVISVLILNVLTSILMASNKHQTVS